MPDDVVVSFGDAVLRRSDVGLLRGPHWLNDRVITFYFEHMHEKKFEASPKMAFVSPEVTHFLKLVANQVRKASPKFTCCKLYGFRFFSGIILLSDFLPLIYSEKADPMNVLYSSARRPTHSSAL